MEKFSPESPKRFFPLWFPIFLLFVHKWSKSLESEGFKDSVTNVRKLYEKDVKNNFFILAGSDGYPLQFIDGVIPDEIQIPGTVALNMHCSISKDMPKDLIIKLKLKKLEPFPMDVPCLNGLGSWYGFYW